MNVSIQLYVRKVVSSTENKTRITKKKNTSQGEILEFKRYFSKRIFLEIGKTTISDECMNPV